MLNRTISKTVPGAGTSTFQYDVTASMPEGCVGEITTDSKGNVNTKVFDKAGRLYQVTADGDTTTYAYYDNGNRQLLTYPNGITAEYTYYGDNRLHTLANKCNGGSIINAYNYTYDNNGNLLTKLDISGTTSYTYDALNRLLSVTEPDGKVTAYTFDVSGNRATQQVTNGSDVTLTEYTYTAQNRLTSAAETKSDGTVKTTGYSYDNNGNTVSSREETLSGASGTESAGLSAAGDGAGAKYAVYGYDAYNRLVSAKDNDSVSSYAYNGDGLRVGKTVTKDNATTTTKFVYEYDKVVLELDENGGETAYNVYGGDMLLSRKTGTTTIYYLYNGHGDVVNLTDDTGAVVMTYDYDAFGKVTTATGSVTNSYLYAGYQFDSETGMYYLNARYYDPVTSRMLSADTYLGDITDPLSLNLYTYCANNPIKYIDPTGHVLTDADKATLTPEQKQMILAATAEYEAAYKAGDTAAMTAAHNAAEAVRDGANTSLRDLTAASEGAVDSYNNTTKTATVTVNGVTQTFTIGDGTNGTYAVINGHIIMDNNQFDLLFTKCDQGVFTTTSQVVDTNVTAATVSATVTTTKIQYWGLGVTTTVSTSGTTVANSFYKSTSDPDPDGGGGETYANVATQIADLPHVNYECINDYKDQVIDILNNLEIPDNIRAFINAALDELNESGAEFRKWAGLGSGDSWCAAFVSWCAYQADILGDLVPRYTSCIGAGSGSGIGKYAADRRFILTMDVSKFSDVGLSKKGKALNNEARKYSDYYNSNYITQPGDVVFFRWANSGGEGYHTGIVLFADPNSDYVYTIEGNTSGDKSSSQVAIKCRNANEIFGYGQNS